MAQQLPTYYRPYLPSDSELSDAESDTTYSFTSQASSRRPSNATDEDLGSEAASVTAPDFARLAKGLQVDAKEVGGPSFVTLEQTDAYGKNKIDTRLGYSPYDAPDLMTGKLESAITSVATVAMLQSRDRDKIIWPQPTDCQLFLPRVYKNVSAFQITQLNLISAFFYFRANKENLNIQIIEKDRILYDGASKPSTLTNGSTITLTLNNDIREGSYNITQLLNELQTQLNRTPLFYDFLNGFSDFLPLFSVNGDYSVNFNYPGDNYYDAVRKVFIQNPTRSQIVGYYFQSQFAGQFSFTIEEVRVGYYYPVLKELVLDPDSNLDNYNFTYGSMSRTEVIQHIIYTFTGLQDPIVRQVITNNITGLDQYRLSHTFRYYPVNRYICSYDPANNRVTLQCPTLNTSLVSLLNTQYNSYLSQLLSQYSLTPTSYQSLATQLNNLLSVLQNMYDYMQVLFANYFAINYGTFSRTYYANSNNTVLLRPGLDASGISIRYDPNVAPSPRDTDLAEDVRKNPPYYWNRMKNLNVSQGGVEGAQRNMGKTTESYPSSSNFPYLLTASNINLTANFIDVNKNVYTDSRRRAGDILVNIDPSKYTVFQFRSRYRQTLQVETLPRQTIFRYPAWNQSHVISSNLSNLFDISYSYVSPIAGNVNKVSYDISYNSIVGWLNTSNTTTNFGFSYAQSSNLWGSSYEELNIANSNGKYYYFQTPSPSNAVDRGSNVYKYPFNLTVHSANGSNFSEDHYAFFYHDVASFMADISGVRLESPIHYKYRLSVPKNTLSNTYSFTAYANQQYYVLFRPATPVTVSAVYRIIPWFPNGSNFSTLSQSGNFDNAADPATMLSNFNVAINNDPDYIRLPIQSTLWSPSPLDAEINKLLPADPPVIGYDSNRVSNDLTDYFAFAPFDNISSITPSVKIRIDPTNNYVFQCNSPYSDTAQSYFYSTSQNAIYTSNADFQYTWKGAKYRNYKIFHQYGPNYIQDPTETTYGANEITSYITPYVSSTTSTPITNYTYAGSNQFLSLGSGVVGWTFLPGDGTWAVERITFKDNFVTPESSNCKNRQIHALAVFFTSEIVAAATSFIRLSNALAVCLLESKTTFSTNSLNLGADAAFGTYYTYSNFSTLVTRSNFTISGYTQVGKQFIPDQNTYYSVIPFNFPEYENWNLSTLNFSTLKTQLSNANIVPIQNLVGSAIPYPYGAKAFVSTVFYDNQPNPTPYGVVLSAPITNSNYGPPAGADESMSVYEQSLPIVNSHLQYLQGQNIISDISGFSAWSNLPIQPSFLVASIPNRMLFQNGNFAIASYTSYKTISNTTQPQRTFSNALISQLTVQQIYPDSENTSLIGVSGNTSEYCFLGASTISATLSQLRFKLYNPNTGQLTELPINPNYTFSNSLLLQHFVFHNTHRWFVSAKDETLTKVILTGASTYSSNTNNQILYSYTSQKYTELAMDPSGAYLYFGKYSDPLIGFSNYSLFSFVSSDTTGFVDTSSTGYTINYEAGANIPPTFTQMAVTINRDQEELVFLNSNYATSRFYKLRLYRPTGLPSVSNAFFDWSAQILKDSTQSLLTPSRIVGGAQGSKWLLFYNNPYVMGNRNDAFDAPVALNLAWQVFFPVQKIQLRKLTSSSTPIVDLTNLAYPEYPHVMMFAYSNYASLVADLSGNNGQWGLEKNTNFFASDVSFNGFYFNSYIFDVPLYPNCNAALSNFSNDYYIAVRGYLPTEKFQTLMRFYLPNRYDFGYLKLSDIANEIAISSSNTNDFNPVYYRTLTGFNSNFIFTKRNFGSNINTGFAGSNLSSIGFGDFLNQYKRYYDQYITDSSLLSTIQTSLQNNINNFIQTDLKYILPTSALTRQRFIDPLLFKINWLSDLSPNFVTLDDEWGLGWNLGYIKEDTGFATIHTGSSFFKIQQDFIYLRLNPEFAINKMDAGGKENYRVTREPTGTTNQYYCKLLLTNFGGNATTFIHNPINFNPPLNRLTKLTFQWLDSKGILIDNNDAEWNMTVNVTERSEIQSLPARMEYKIDPKIKTPDMELPSTLRVPDAQAKSNLSTSQANVEAAKDPRLSTTAIYVRA